MEARLEAILDLDRLARGIGLAHMKGDDAKGTQLYAEFLHSLQYVTEKLGLDWIDTLDAIHTAATEDTFAA